MAKQQMCLGGYNGKKIIVLSPFITGWGPPCTYSLTMFGGFRWFGSTTPKIDGNMTSCDFRKDCIIVYQGLLSMSLFLGWGFGNITMVGPSKNRWVTSLQKNPGFQLSRRKNLHETASWSCGFFMWKQKTSRNLFEHLTKHMRLQICQSQCFLFGIIYLDIEFIHNCFRSTFLLPFSSVVFYCFAAVFFSL